MRPLLPISAEDEVLAELAGISRGGWSHDSRVFAKALILLLKRNTQMAKELDELTSEVSNVTTVEQSAITLINGLAQKITDAGTDPAKLQALTDSLTASSNSLAAAVAANTPTTDNPSPAAA